MSDIVVDAVGLLCPQPVILLARAARDHPGSVLELLADDPAASADVPAWCSMRGAELLSVGERDGVLRFRVRPFAEPSRPDQGDRTGGSDSAADTRSR